MGIASAASAPALARVLACWANGFSRRGTIITCKERDFLLCPVFPSLCLGTCPFSSWSAQAASCRACCFLAHSIRFTCNGKRTSGTAGRCSAGCENGFGEDGGGLLVFSQWHREEAISHFFVFSKRIPRSRASLHTVCNVGRFGMNEAFFRISRNWEFQQYFALHSKPLLKKSE